MNKATLFVAAAALAALPVSAFAAGLTTTANTAVQTATGATVLTDKSTYADVVSTLSATGTAGTTTSTTDISKIKASTKVSFVLVSKLKGYSAAALSHAQTSSMTSLDSKVAANAALTAKLKKAGYLPSDVAAVSVAVDGNVTVFIAK